MIPRLKQSTARRRRNKDEKNTVLCGRLLLMACMTVCFTHVALAGSGNEAFRSVNHKGYNTLAPENTLPAFELSAQMGYQYVETLDPYVTGATVDRYIYARPEIKLSTDVYTCSGEVIKPEVTVRLDGMELEEDDYELTWSEGCTEPGTYQVTARLTKGILAGADTAEFTIMEADKVLSDKKQDGQGQS